MTATTRGTSNGNANGNSRDRKRRREWLIETYRADVDVLVKRLFLQSDDPYWRSSTPPLLKLVGCELEVRPLSEGVPACRCYRCGTLLTVLTVTVDRIIPGCKGGTYRRTNIRPACGSCNSRTGGALRS